jgi:O-antigen/teichoic acid export membrane protein
MDINRLRSWGTRGGLAILDQGAYSGSNFILNIILARWLTQQDYGAFSVAFSLVLFFSSFHNAIQLEPMSIIGPANYSEDLDEFLHAQIRLNFIITIPIALLLFMIGFVLQFIGTIDSWMSRVLISAGLALPFIFFLWVVRRTFYVRRQLKGALFSSVLYAFLVLGGLFVAHRFGLESSLTGFGLMGAASLLSGLITLLWWRKGLARGKMFVQMNKVMSSHWHFGKWALAAAALAVAAGQVQILLTASMIDLEAAGAFRAMQNFVLPMLQTISAISILGLPVLSADFGRGDYSGLRRKGFTIAFSLTGMAFLYLIAMWLLAVPLDQWLYGGKYSAYIWLVAPFCLVPIFTSMETGFSLTLRSIQKVRIYLIDGVVSGVTGIVTSFIFIKAWGITGSVFSMVTTSLVSLITFMVLFKMWFPHVQPAKEISQE